MRTLMISLLLVVVLLGCGKSPSGPNNPNNPNTPPTYSYTTPISQLPDGVVFQLSFGATYAQWYHWGTYWIGGVAFSTTITECIPSTHHQWKANSLPDDILVFGKQVTKVVYNFGGNRTVCTLVAYNNRQEVHRVVFTAEQNTLYARGVNWDF